MIKVKEHKNDPLKFLELIGKEQKGPYFDGFRYIMEHDEKVGCYSEDYLKLCTTSELIEFYRELKSFVKVPQKERGPMVKKTDKIKTILKVQKYVNKMILREFEPVLPNEIFDIIYSYKVDLEREDMTYFTYNGINTIMYDFGKFSRNRGVNSNCYIWLNRNKMYYPICAVYNLKRHKSGDETFSVYEFIDNMRSRRVFNRECYEKGEFMTEDFVKYLNYKKNKKISTISGATICGKKCEPLIFQFETM